MNLKHGVTLVELIIALTICSVAMVAAYQVGSISNEAIYTEYLQEDLDTRAQQIVDRIANEAKDGIASTFVIGAGSDSLDFKRSIGFDSINGLDVAGPDINYRAEALTDRNGNLVYCLTRSVSDATAILSKSVLADYLTGNPYASPIVPPLGPNPPGQAVYFAMPDRFHLTITVTLERTNFRRFSPTGPRFSYTQTSTASTTIRIQN